MKLNKSKRDYKKTPKLALSPSSPYLYSPYLSPPLATSTKKETKPKAESKDPAAK
jgi:hypothetical protein